MSNLAAKRETTVTIINQLCGSISRRRCTDGPVHLCSAPAKEPSLERSEEMAVGEGLIGVPARLSPPSQPPHSLRRSAVWPKPRCPDMVICLDTYTCISIYIYIYACACDRLGDEGTARQRQRRRPHYLVAFYLLCSLLSITHTQLTIYFLLRATTMFTSP